MVLDRLPRGLRPTTLSVTARLTTACSSPTAADGKRPGWRGEGSRAHTRWPLKSRWPTDPADAADGKRPGWRAGNLPETERSQAARSRASSTARATPKATAGMYSRPMSADTPRSETTSRASTRDSGNIQRSSGGGRVRRAVQARCNLRECHREVNPFLREIFQCPKSVSYDPRPGFCGLARRIGRSPPL